jgi:hypothetical protein
MDGMGDKVFSGSTFAANQHGGVAVGNLLDKTVDLLHRAAAADHIVYVEAGL